jgi:spermidine/putrescine-binding protein
MKTMNMKKTTFAMFIIAILATLVMPLAAAASVNVEYVKVNGDELINGTTERLELSEELDIKVRIIATDNVSNIKVSAELTGYEYADRNQYDIYDVIVIDDLDEGDATSRTLTIEVPKDIFNPTPGGAVRNAPPRHIHLADTRITFHSSNHFKL